MSTVRFISTTYLKNNSVIEKNVEDEILLPHIDKSQYINIQQVLGTALYDSLVSKVLAGTVTGAYKTLMDNYVQPAMVEWSLYYVIPTLSMRAENSGIVQKNTESSQPVDLSSIKYLRDDVRNTAEFYSERLSKYLCANQSSFPEYNSESETDELRPNKNNYFSGIYLEGGINKMSWPTYDEPDNCC